MPHKDTLINIIFEIKFEELEKLQTNIIKIFIKYKMFEKFRFNGMFQVVIDITGLYSTKVNLGQNAISKTFNKDKENEYTLYSYYALEAKLVWGNMTFSPTTEFVENETYADELGNTYRKFDKQDCELKVAYRLLNKIKKRFPKLPIINWNALYLVRSFLELCDSLKFDYIIGYKETDVPSIKRNFDEIKIVEKILNIKMRLYLVS